MAISIHGRCKRCQWTGPEEEFVYLLESPGVTGKVGKCPACCGALTIIEIEEAQAATDKPQTSEDSW